MTDIVERFNPCNTDACAKQCDSMGVHCTEICIDEIERLRTEVLDLKATIPIYVRELAELRKASSTPTIPEGWQLVPEELLNAVEQFVDRVERGEVRSVMTYEKFKKALAMLAAAPKHEEK